MGYLLADTTTLTVETTTNDELASWRNTIDIYAGVAGPTPLPGDAIVSAFITFMQFVQRDDCHLSRIFLRDWVRGAGEAGHEVALWDEPLALPCDNAGEGHAFPLATGTMTPTLGEVVVVMTKARFVGGGRKHHMSLRNVVWQELLQNTAGQGPALTTPNEAIVPPALSAWALLNLEPFYAPVSGPRFVLVDASVTHSIPPQARQIGSIDYQRLSMRNLHSVSRR
jgi:hypothetical protein